MKELETGKLYKKRHTRAIKEKLLTAKRNFEETNYNGQVISFYYIENYLNDNTDLYVTFVTVKNCLTLMPSIEEEPESLNTTIVIELCKYFNVDPAYILALPNDNSTPPTPAEYGLSVKQMDDPRYFGNFNCYRLSTSMASEKISDSEKKDTLRKNDNITWSELEIGKKGNNVIATMIVHTQGIDIDEKVERVTTFTGTPILYTKTNNILINLNSNDGQFYTLFFDYQDFSSGNMYYREAIFLSAATGTSHYPIVSKMIITRDKIDESGYKYLLGLLSFNEKTIIISKDKFDSMLGDKEIARFNNDFKNHLKLWKRDFLIIPENIVANENPHTDMSSLELKKVLLLLRNQSYSEAQIIVGDSYKSSVIGRDLQSELRKKRKNNN